MLLWRMADSEWPTADSDVPSAIRYSLSAICHRQIFVMTIRALMSGVTVALEAAAGIGHDGRHPRGGLGRWERRTLLVLAQVELSHECTEGLGHLGQGLSTGGHFLYLGAHLLGAGAHLFHRSAILFTHTGNALNCLRYFAGTGCHL